MAIPLASAQEDIASPGNHPLWRSMGGMPGTNGAVFCSAVDASGNLYIGGNFTVAGNVRSEAAKFAANNDLIVGGDFRTIGDIEASGIARFDGNRWWSLGSGVDGEVHSLATSQNGEVFAGGKFNTAGGVASKSIARWNGAQWSWVGPANMLQRPFGQGLAIECVALSTGGVLHVGYRKTLTDSHAMTRLVSNVWQEIGNGFSGTPRSIVFDDRGGIYAGGIITLTGPSPRHVLRGITHWNGTRWSSMGNEGLGMGLASSDVMAMTMDNCGNLVLAGDFLGSSDGVVSPFLIRTRTNDFGLWPALGSLPPDRLGPLDQNGPLGLQNWRPTRWGSTRCWQLRRICRVCRLTMRRSSRRIPIRIQWIPSLEMRFPGP